MRATAGRHLKFSINIRSVPSLTTLLYRTLVPSGDTAVVNKTKEFYFERQGSADFEPYAAAAKRAVLIGQILLMGGLVGLFILIPVLLAIERHLRDASFEPAGLQSTPGA
jgi:hypothetical protein